MLVKTVKGLGKVVGGLFVLAFFAGLFSTVVVLIACLIGAEWAREDVLQDFAYIKITHWHDCFEIFDEL